jgi:hypothetical protein
MRYSSLNHHSPARSRDVGLVALALVILVLAPPVQARRLALVIGNDSYQNVQSLKNARSDAKAIAAELKAVGFEVSLKQDLNQKMMKAALRDFKAHVAGGDDVVFFFSGHGVQFGGTNYLVPIDISADSEAQVADDAVPLQRILDDLAEQKARFALAIIDACRNNPFKTAHRAIGGRGLAPVAPATGQMIMYSAGAGQEALDRLGSSDTNPNGVFTRVLIQGMRKPGVPAGSLLKDVQTDVVELANSVGQEQVPALYDQSLGKFYFRSGAPAAAASANIPTPALAAAIHVPTAAELDESYWQRIKSSTDASDFTGYGANFPQGMHIAEARMMARKLARVAAAKPAPRPIPGHTAALSASAADPATGRVGAVPELVGKSSAFGARQASKFISFFRGVASAATRGGSEFRHSTTDSGSTNSQPVSRRSATLATCRNTNAPRSSSPACLSSSAHDPQPTFTHARMNASASLTASSPAMRTASVN